MECEHEFKDIGLESDEESFYIVYVCAWCGEEVHEEQQMLVE